MMDSEHRSIGYVGIFPVLPKSILMSAPPSTTHTKTNFGILVLLGSAYEVSKSLMVVELELRHCSVLYYFTSV